MLDLKPVFDKLREQSEILKEMLGMVKFLVNDRIKNIDKIKKLEQQKADLVAEIERIEKAEQIDINIDLDDYK